LTDLLKPKEGSQMRKVTVNITVQIQMSIDEGTEVEDVIDEMDYEFNPSTDHSVSVEDTEILSYEVIDSK